MDAVEFLDKVDRLSKRGSTEEKMRYNVYRIAGDNTGAVKLPMEQMLVLWRGCRCRNRRR